MKKLGILVMPLMAVSLLMSCGSKPSSEYLELWNKETIYNKDGSINQEETRKYQDKLMVQNVTTKYHYGDSPWKEIDTYEYTYNEYGNVTTIKQTHESINDNKTSWTRIIQYAYQYQDGLMISKDIIIPEGNKYSASHFEYKYDSNRRLISESTTTRDGTPVYDDTYTYQKDFTNFLTYKHEDHPQSAAYDESYRIERVLDDNGYITEETHYDLSNAAQDERYRRACYTYDKYHCLIVEKIYRHLYEGEEEKLIMTITTSYHRHNPNKPEKIETVYHYRSNAQTQTDIYSYDKYHRKVCIDSVYINEEKIDEQAKTTYEYDELIKA